MSSYLFTQVNATSTMDQIVLLLHILYIHTCYCISKCISSLECIRKKCKPLLLHYTMVVDLQGGGGGMHRVAHSSSQWSTVVHWEVQITKKNNIYRTFHGKSFTHYVIEVSWLLMIIILLTKTETNNEYDNKYVIGV